MTWNLETAFMERIQEHAQSIIYRAKHRDTGKVKIIKQSKSAAYDALLEQEYANSRLFKHEEMLVPARRLVLEGRPALDLGETAAIPLPAYLTAKPLDIVELLQLAIAAVQMIGKLHRLKYVHQAISPFSFFIETDRKKLILTQLQHICSLVSFGDSEIVQDESACALDSNALDEEHLPYAAPERMSDTAFSFDERADLYSLGALFYRFATGKQPFYHKDDMERLHTLTTQLEADGHVPKALSDIILRCMAVQPERRYQSAQALERDLELFFLRLRSEWNNGTPPSVTAESTMELQISDTLYGRDSEMHTLLQSYQRALLGGFETVFVSGLSGIGKSFLIHEFRQTMQRGKGLFMSGKFDQYKQEIPYRAIHQIGRQLFHHLLSLDKEQYQVKIQQINDAVGPNGQVLIDMNPDLERILGKQPPLAKLPPTEMYNRFLMTLHQYLSVFSTKDHPLVYFLDDLQWADPASIQLITDLLHSSDGKYIMFIGAYRGQEITDNHPLQRMLVKLSRIRRIQMSHIVLEPLSESHMSKLLADSLHPTKQSIATLAALLMRKTKGNAFFAKQFFRSLYDLRLLRFNVSEYCWEWDTDQIDELYITDNVVDFMMTKIRRLPEPVQRILMDAACIGNEFTPETLSLVTKLPDGEAAVLLTKAIDEGMLLRIAHIRSPDRSSSALYKFMHDRVHQAVYSIVPNEEKKRIHLRIGQSLQRELNFEQREDRLFDIVKQLNLGAELLDKLEEKDNLLMLNLKACRKAKGNSAYETAFHYAVSAVNLLQPGDCWIVAYATAFEVHMELAELNYLCGHFDEAKRIFATLLQHVKTKFEKADIYNLMMVLYTNLGQHEEALQVGLDGLRLFGIKFPSQVSTPRMLWEMVKARYYVGLKRPEDLIDHPLMTNPNHKAVMQLMVNLIPPSYFVNSGLYICLMLRTFSYSLHYGHSEGSAYAYSAYGVIVSSLLGRLKSGRAYGLLGLQLSDMFDHLPTKSKVYFAYGGFTSSLSGHIGANVGYLQKAYQYGIESGDFVYAGYSITFSFFLRLFRGDPLSEVLKESDAYHSFIYKAQDQDAISIFTVLQRYVLYMKEAPLAFQQEQKTAQDDAFMTDDEVDHLERLTNKATIHTYYALRAQSYYMMNRLEAAERICELAEASITTVFGLPHMHLHHFHRGMVFAGLYASRPEATRKRYKRMIRKSLRFLDKWSRHSPDNFLHLKLLLEAEWNRIIEKPELSASLYDQAIHHAGLQRFVQFEAMACECAAKFYSGTGKPAEASSYYAKALALYKKWGAMRKAADMEGQQPIL
ncbi:ATP-binding protein [Paenibacillus allorhizosphaerae]|uniref:Serine/threonine-protein kinase PknD n=1 Tax=Paenibacillus allorhizosphaerae TaxID=2849866 RepID=A0ABM8VE05_9BACL|nr:AAA family ATPase [Paenibacillus allorhizosphaerae]CAG7629508.1 Serine/threonine-protein kinase PknD [Paenibacillus allorhizosphaerae]